MIDDAWTLEPCSLNGSTATPEVALSGVLVPRRGTTATLFKQHPDLRKISQALVERFGSGAGLAECDGASLPRSLVGAAVDLPVWYLKLPGVWRSVVEDLLSNASLYVYLDRDPQDPWHIAQWLSLRARPVDGSASIAEVRVDEDLVSRSLYGAAEDRDLLVFIECDGLVGWNAVVKDEELYVSLQAGGVASSRHPLFDVTRAQVQSMVRDLQDGRSSQTDPAVLTLPVLQCWKGERRARLGDEFGWAQLASRPFRAHHVSPGAVGLLPTIVNYIPPGLDDGDAPWLKLEVPAEMWPELQVRRLNPRVVRLGCNGGAEFIGIRLTEGLQMLEAYIDAGDPAVSDVLSDFVKSGVCRVALEDESSGRLLGVTVEWPSDCRPWNEQDCFRSPVLDFGDYVHQDSELRARELAREEGGQVSLYVCQVLDARRWQRHDRKVSSHGVGPRGGLLDVDATPPKLFLH